MSRKSTLAWLLCMSLSAQATTILFVDQDATNSTHDGSTWCKGFTTLQDALASASPNTIIIVAQGTYRPDQGGSQVTGNRSATFRLQNGVTLTGGFAGCDQPSPDDHDVIEHETILTGDLLGNDGPNFSNNDENSYHVVTANFTNSSAILNGFTITAGNADGPDPDLRGGGMMITNASPTIQGCIFRKNKATLGAAINCEEASPTITDSAFTNNVANFSGGAMRTWSSSPAVFNCLFVNNSAEAGGAAWHGSSTPHYANCTFFGNSANQGNALALDSCCPEQPSTLSATTCIFWNGPDQLSNEDGSSLSIIQSAVQGGWKGDGNIADDPQFIPGPIGCFYLSQTTAGQDATSPCVDSGSVLATELGMDAFTTRSDELGDAGILDMGFHFPITGRPLIMGDQDRNQRVDLSDIAEFQRCFTADGPTDVPPCCRIFDYEMDADIDLDDMLEFQQAITGP